MPLPRTLAALALAFALPASAELSPADLAAIQRDQQKATDAVAKQHGNKQPSEMTNEERAAAIHEEQAALQDVLEKHGVDAKEYARRMATLSLEERQQVEQAVKALEEKEKAEAAAKACQEAKGEECPPAEPEISRGLGDEDPVVVDEDPDEPTVENLAGAPDQGASTADSAPAPAPPAKGKPSKQEGKSPKHGPKHVKHR